MTGTTAPSCTGTGTSSSCTCTAAGCCAVSGNGVANVAGANDGMLVSGAGSTAKITECLFLANAGNGVHVSGSSSIDLGSTLSGGTDGGGTVLQSANTTLSNKLAGLCNETTSNVDAENDHWSACPPKEGSGQHLCNNGLDIGTNNSGGTFNTSGCFTP